MSPAEALPTARPSGDDDAPSGRAGAAPTFEQAYEQHFDFVWRSVRRLGVAEHAVDDAVQEVFLVVHRKLPAFEGRASLKTWLFSIVLRVVGEHRRRVRRKGEAGAGAVDPDSVPDAGQAGPHEQASRAEAVRLLHALLDELDDDKRAAFVLAELEELTVPEIAEATGANVNTVYSRLRAARAEIEKALARHRARAAWRQR